jgi:eukaryotic-like serine/threonine-protein kinase
MDEKRWLDVRQHFEAAVSMPPDQREAHVRSACGDDAELRALVLALLAADRTGPEWLEAGPGFELLDALDPALPASPAPPRIPAYHVMEEVGRGGMGVVYRATRADGAFDRAVALKVVRAGFDSPDVRARFGAEQRILANLEHPNIARLYDAGYSEDGRPFLVMELVDGQPIDQYCDAKRLGIRERVELFRAVCDAVQYAHRSLVIHRDLKPSNVLIDPGGTAKLLDFGIARLVEPATADAPGTTTGHRLLTPEYASPEQLRGEPLTTSTDVYSLGVILYELLTGFRPFDVGSRAFAAALGAGLRSDPPLPSRVVTGGIEGRSAAAGPAVVGVEELARRRGTTTDRLHRTLRGDLDRILLTSLAIESAERYASVEALSDDLHRYLAGLPVQAQPPSLRYRAGKFARRNRAAVAATAAVALSLGIGAGLATRQARLAADQRDVAVSLSDFMAGVFQAPDPFADERLDTLRVAALLQLGATRVRTELADRPALQARMFGVLGDAHRSLGLLPAARSLLEDALAAARAGGEDSPDVAAAQHALARVLAEQADYDAAEPLYRAALEARRRHARPEDTSETLAWLGEMLREQGRYDEARERLSEAVAMDRALAQRSGRGERLAASLGMLASLHQTMGDYAAAEPLRREALATRRRTLDPGHPLIADALGNLATALFQLGRLDEATDLQREALDIYGTALPDPHPKLANALNTMGVLLTDHGDYDGARSALGRAVAMRRQLYGDDHPGVASALNNQAFAILRAGDPAGAEATYRESLAMNRRIYGDDHFEVAKLLNNLGAALSARGRDEEAERARRDAVALLQRIMGDQPPTGIMMGNHASDLRRLNRLGEAERTYRRALEILADKLPADHPSTARVRLGLGGTLRELGRYDEAEPLLREAARVLEGDARPAEELAALDEATGRRSTADGRERVRNR